MEQFKHELLPCPFCGGMAELKHTKSWDYFVRCQSCGARTRQHHENDVGAVDGWNRRAGRGECRNVHEPPKNTPFWPTPRFKCSVCGATHISVEYVYYCPNCGRKVIDG